MKKIFYLILIMFSMLALVSCANVEEKPSILANVIFEDLIVEYNGEEQEVRAFNLPDGITVEYENNKATLPGDYDVIATFKDANGQVIATLTVKLIIKEPKVEINLDDVVFDGDSVPYDGNPHSLKATNVPNGVRVEYEGNNMSSVGTHVVTAKFYDSNNQLLLTLTANLTLTCDLSGIVFKDSNITFDNLEHSIIASNIPDGIRTEYTGNDVSTVGSHVVTAKFYDVNDQLLLTLTANLIITEANQDTPGVDVEFPLV